MTEQSKQPTSDVAFTPAVKAQQGAPRLARGLRTHGGKGRLD